MRLSKAFEIKELGPLRYFLGIKVARTECFLLSQKKYVADLLTERTMGRKPSNTPIRDPTTLVLN